MGTSQFLAAEIAFSQRFLASLHCCVTFAISAFTAQARACKERSAQARVSRRKRSASRSALGTFSIASQAWLEPKSAKSLQYQSRNPRGRAGSSFALAKLFSAF